jgi:hypothetical protein
MPLHRFRDHCVITLPLAGTRTHHLSSDGHRICSGASKLDSPSARFPKAGGTFVDSASQAVVRRGGEARVIERFLLETRQVGEGGFEGDYVVN